MEILHSTLNLDESGIRVRFLVASILQDAVRHLIPQATVHPFGSLASGLGSHNCDLDLLLHTVEEPQVRDYDAPELLVVTCSVDSTALSP